MSSEDKESRKRKAVRFLHCQLCGHVFTLSVAQEVPSGKPVVVTFNPIMSEPKRTEDSSSRDPLDYANYLLQSLNMLVCQERAAHDNAKRRDGSPAEPWTVGNTLLYDFGLPFNEVISDKIDPRSFHYSGQSLLTLNGAFDFEYLKQAQNPIDVIVLISAHGDAEGNFLDLIDGKEFTWTPRTLWEGNDRWSGLQTVASQIKDHRLRIVAAQCRGVKFADELRKIVEQNPEFSNVTVDGLGEKEVKQLTLPPKKWKKYENCLSVFSFMPLFTAWFSKEYSAEKLDPERAQALHLSMAKKQRKKKSGTSSK